MDDDDADYMQGSDDEVNTPPNIATSIAHQPHIAGLRLRLL